MKSLALLFGFVSFAIVAPLCAQQAPQLPVPDVKLAPPAKPPEDFVQPLTKAIDEAKTRNYDQAIVDAERSRALAEQQLGPNDKTVGNIVGIIGQLHLANREYDKARTSYTRVLQIEGEPTDAKSVDVKMASELSKMGSAAEFQENPSYVRATELYQQALAIRETLFGHDSVEIAGNVYDLANSWVFQEKFAEAEPLFARAVAICEKDTTAKNSVLPVVLNEQAGMFVKQHRYQRAESTYKRALAIAQTNADDALSVAILDSLTGLYKETSRPADAAKMSKQSEKIRARIPSKADA